MKEEWIKYHKYLNELQKCRTVNMYGAGEYLRGGAFEELNKQQSWKILNNWMDNYDEIQINLEEKNKMSELKFGDWVKCNLEKSDERYFEGVRQITGMQGMAYCVGGKYVYMANELYLVCGFVKGQEIEACGECSGWFKCTFYSYDPNLEEPYLVMLKSGGVNNWKEARAIEPKYVPYKEPKLEWIGKKLICICNDTNVEIKGIYKDDYGEFCLFLKNRDTMSLKNIIKYYTWADGSPCGELKD